MVTGRASMMRKVSFIFLSCVLTNKCEGAFDRVQIPLQKLPSASNDIFDWRMPDGSYQFGMQGHDQWRVEKRYPNGGTYVHYAYKTPDGQVHSTEYTSGPPQAAIVRGPYDANKGGSKYEKYETSDAILEGAATQLSSRSLESKSGENQVTVETAADDIVQGQNQSLDLPTNDDGIVEKEVLKIEEAKKPVREQKQSLLDNYVQKQNKAAISKSRSFYGISYKIQKPQKSASIKDVLGLQTLPNKTSEENPKSKKYGNRRSRLLPSWKSNNNTGKKKAVAIALF